KPLCRVLRPPIIALSLCGVLASPAICQEDEVAATQEADEQAAKEPAADAQPAEAEADPAEPQPVGKLQIRKGTGRPPGQRAFGGEVMAVEAFVEPGGGIIPDAAV